MITKISKLSHFGIFQDFSWKKELTEFNKFNLIYGWNRSGKTTISRVFSCCEKREDNFTQYPDNGKFEIKTSNSTTIKNTDVVTSNLLIKVFNQDFIDDNISFNPSISCNPIVYISEEDIESKKQLEILNAGRITLGKEYENAKKNNTTKKETINSFLVGLGREIANILFDKSYNKTKAENKINTIGVDNFPAKILTDENKKKYETISKSEAGKELDLYQKYKFSFPFLEETINNFEKIYEATDKLLGTEVISETLDRLKDDQDLNTWVKQGFDLHRTRKEKENCLFCQRPLDNNLLSSLSRHFSKDYEDLQNSITKLKAEISKLKKEKIPLKNDDFYPDLREDYIAQTKTLNEAIEKINSWLDIATSKLSEKYNNPLIVIVNQNKSEEYLDIYNNNIDGLNNIVSKHNEKIKNHETEVKNAREKLELHSIAVALSVQDYKKLESELKEAKDTEQNTLEAVNKNNADILYLEKKTSNIGKAINNINKHLKEFFGREEIILVLDASKKGYIIKRNGEPAKNLSESEKTAIAFAYFIVKTKEKDFKIEDSIIFIDDPVSSFDLNFIYHAFSLMQHHFKEADQLFISTHNFQLFNLVKDWFLRNNQNRKKKGKNECCEFYMIENYIESSERYAKIVGLDKTLRDYKSEYHFLFSRLNEFKDIDLSYADFYTIGNIARRFFDIFADFKIPDSRDQRQKMEAIVKEINSENEKISAVECGKAYKLINEFSHNSDPTSTIEHKNKSESKEAIEILLNIVKESDPWHYKILEKNI